MKLTSDNVEQVFTDCLFREDENTDSAIKVEGIMHPFGFHPARLMEHEKDIKEMLSFLPDQFHQDKGDGWSFLNACEDNEGNQWTGLHMVMEQLFVLGMAIGKVRCLLPRDMWNVLPGGMPYYVVMK